MKLELNMNSKHINEVAEKEIEDHRDDISESALEDVKRSIVQRVKKELVYELQKAGRRLLGESESTELKGLLKSVEIQEGLRPINELAELLVKRTHEELREYFVGLHAVNEIKRARDVSVLIRALNAAMNDAASVASVAEDIISDAKINAVVIAIPNKALVDRLAGISMWLDRNSPEMFKKLWGADVVQILDRSK